MPRTVHLGVLIMMACRPPDGAAGEGQLEASWSDAGGTARLVAPAEARWCARDSMLELLAVRNDSALGIALYASDSLRAESYPLFLAGVFAPWRPQATAALRLPLSNELRTYSSAWGQLQLTKSAAGVVSGTFDLHLKRATPADSLQVTGRFTRVAVRPAELSCGRADKPAIQ